MAFSRVHVPLTKVFQRFGEYNYFKTTPCCSRAANTYTWEFRIGALIRYQRKQSGSGIRTIIQIGLKS